MADIPQLIYAMKNLLLALLVTVSAVNASAAMVYGDRTYFTAAVSSPTTVTFEDIGAAYTPVFRPSPFITNNVTFTGNYLGLVSPFPALGRGDYTTGTGTALYTESSPTLLDIALPGSYSAFGTDLRAAGPFNTIFYTLTFSDGEIFTSVSVNGNTSFFGVTLNGPITGVSISGLSHLSDTNYSSFDNVTFANTIAAPNPTKVPEPATVALFGLGVLGFAASRRKSAK